MTEKTNIGELAEFFPGCSAKTRSEKVQAFPWQAGETIEQAKARHEAKKARIEQAIAAQKLAAAVNK